MEVKEVNALRISLFENDWLPERPTELTSIEGLEKDLWGFGYLWDEVVQTFSTVEELYAAIQDIRDELRTLKEIFRSLSVDFPDYKIVPNGGRGVSGSYFLIDDEGRPLFVIKPLDEDAGCIDSDGWASPFHMSPVRSNMPLYRSAMREALAYMIGETMGLDSIVPKTVLGVIESDQFHSLSDQVALNELRRYFELCGPEDKEKLCSVQEYVPDAKSLFEAIHELERAHLSDEEIANRFDQTNFEEANILLWTTYDTDGHMGNFLVYPKGADEIGNEIFGLKKIDNSLAFPDKNRQMRNNLSYLPNAQRQLSAEGKAKIAAIDVDVLSLQLEQMGLGSASPALKERIPILQELAQRDGITLKEINTEMANIGNKR